MAYSTTMLIKAAVLIIAMPIADAFWRLPCQGRIGVGRIDPLAQYGNVGEHAHVIHGGNNFGFSAGYDELVASECTSCGVKQDRSVYWTPALYFQAKDGKTTLVNQVGGMLVYYLLFGDNVKAFPAKFQMIAGDGYRRNFTLPVPDPPKSSWSGDQVTESALRQKAVGFNCLDYQKNPEPTLFRHFLPDKAYLDANCPDGVRFELMFPSCWNGKDDSPDHMSHVAYPNQVMTGDCPKGYEQRLVSMLYETIWDTNAFNGKDGQFVLANGDPTGYGYHGDFIAGWDADFLQSAVNKCTNPSGKVEDCPLFDLQSQGEQKKCQMQIPDEVKDEDCKGPRDGLPGNVEIQSGPEPAPRPSSNSDTKEKAKDDTKMEGDSDKKSTTDSSSGDPSPSSSSSSSIVPTLSYTTAATSLSSSPPELRVADVQTSPTTSSSTSTPTTSTSSSTTSPTYESTTFMTKSGGTVMEVFIVQETVSVTLDETSVVTATATATTTTTSASDGGKKSESGSGSGGGGGGVYKMVKKRENGLQHHLHQHQHGHYHR